MLLTLNWVKSEAQRYWSYHIDDYLVSELCPSSSLPTAKQCFINRISFHSQAKRWGGAYTKPLLWALVVSPPPQKVGCISKWCKERNNGIGVSVIQCRLPREAKIKMRGQKLESGAYWKEVLKEKGIKQRPCVLNCVLHKELISMIGGLDMSRDWKYKVVQI